MSNIRNSYLWGFTPGSNSDDETQNSEPQPSSPVSDTNTTEPGPSDDSFTETIIGPNGEKMNVPKAAR